MAKSVLVNSRLFVGGGDLTGVTNKLELSTEIEDKDSTAFGNDGWTEVLGGLAQATLAGGGQWEPNGLGSSDVEIWQGLGNLGPWCAVPAANKSFASSAEIGDLVYFFNALQGNLKFFDQVGEVAPWEAQALSTWPAIRGQVGHRPGVAITATGATSAGVNIGQVPDGGHLYGAVHILSVAGTSSPSITLSVESDNDSGFPSPTTRITFEAASMRRGQIQRQGGPITDNWYRIAYTVTGTDPSFLVFGAMGIL